MNVLLFEYLETIREKRNFLLRSQVPRENPIFLQMSSQSNKLINIHRAARPF